MNTSKIKQMEAIVYELKQLNLKAKNHIEERTRADGYVYANTYHGWLNEYNSLVKKYNKLTSANLSLRSIEDYELSSTHKTVRSYMLILSYMGSRIWQIR